MVVQAESEAPDEVSCTALAQMEPTKYVIVKNHVRELPVTTKETSPCEEASAAEKRDKRKRKKSNVTCDEPAIDVPQTERICEKPQDINVSKTDQSTSEKPVNISASDLEDLRTVYKKCKEVINRIESKYGHFLGLDTESCSSLDKRSSDEYVVECTCSKKKKIIFDDDGQQLLTETAIENHVCPKKFKRRHSDIERRTLDIQYEEPAALPDDLPSLSLILKDSSINKSYRYRVIDKIKLMRFDYLNNIRFDKPALIEKLKRNPDEILDFKGTNLSDIPGYPDKK